MLGDPDNAISYLQQAVDIGWLIAARLEMDPLWSYMQDDGRFQTIIMDVNANLERQREKVAPVLDGLQD